MVQSHDLRHLHYHHASLVLSSPHNPQFPTSWLLQRWTTLSRLPLSVFCSSTTSYVLPHPFVGKVKLATFVGIFLHLQWCTPPLSICRASKQSSSRLNHEICVQVLGFQEEIRLLYREGTQFVKIASGPGCRWSDGKDRRSQQQCENTVDHGEWTNTRGQNSRSFSKLLTVNRREASGLPSQWEPNLSQLSPIWDKLFTLFPNCMHCANVQHGACLWAVLSRCWLTRLRFISQILFVTKNMLSLREHPLGIFCGSVTD